MDLIPVAGNSPSASREVVRPSEFQHKETWQIIKAYYKNWT